MVKRMQDYKYFAGLKGKIYPSDAQKEIIRRSSDAARFVYNRLVYLGKEISRFGKPTLHIDFIDERIAQLNEMKTDKAMKDAFPFLVDPRVDSNALAHARKSYQDAWDFYRKVYNIAPPNFHKKGYEEKYQTSVKYYTPKTTTPTLLTEDASIRFEDAHHIVLPKLGRIRFAGSPKRLKKLFAMAEVRIGTVTITKDEAGEYFVSFQFASDLPFFEEYAKTGSKCGIDLNVKNFYTDDQGEVVENPKSFRRSKKRLGKKQRVLSRRQRRAKKERRKFCNSKNLQKQRVAVAKAHKKIRNRRRNFLDETSTALVKNHDLVVAENLRSKNMMKNHALASSIQDVGWREFIGMMGYKAAVHGKVFMTVDPKNTTQTCSACGHVLKGDEKLTLNDREWDCRECGSHHDRDQNAAKNILAKGEKLFRERKGAPSVGRLADVKGSGN